MRKINNRLKICFVLFVLLLNTNTQSYAQNPGDSLTGVGSALVINLIEESAVEVPSIINFNDNSLNIITVESIERQKDSIQSVTIGSSSDTSFNNLILLIYSKKQYADDNVIAEPKYAKIIRALPAETKIIDRDNLYNINKAVGNNILRISENMSVKISAVDTLGNVSVEIVNAKNTDKTNKIPSPWNISAAIPQANKSAPST